MNTGERIIQKYKSKIKQCKYCSSKKITFKHEYNKITYGVYIYRCLDCGFVSMQGAETTWRKEVDEILTKAYGVPYTNDSIITVYYIAMGNGEARYPIGSYFNKSGGHAVYLSREDVGNFLKSILKDNKSEAEYIKQNGGAYIASMSGPITSFSAFGMCVVPPRKNLRGLDLNRLSLHY